MRRARTFHRAARELEWKLGRPLLVAALLLAASGHVGSPDTWFSGDAGPYRVLVHVRAPGVIPGIAEVTVQVADDPPDEVLMHVNRFDAITAPPPPDPGEPVRGRPGTYRARLWVMTSGSNSVTVQVRGARGEGTVVVPATIVAFRRLEFSRPLALGLGAVGVFLFLGFVTIVGAAVRESVLPPGAAPDPKRRRAAAFAMAGTAGVLALAAFGAKRWWDAEDSAYRQSMFRPLLAAAEVRSEATGPRLVMSIVDEAWRPSAGAPRTISPMVQDHGKLMHLFAVRRDLSGFAHLHPETNDSVSFIASLPPLPSGEYLLFGDVTHESGFAQTLTATVEVPGDDTSALLPSSPLVSSSGDDAWLVGGAAGDREALLPDGSRMRWERGEGEIVAGVPAPLRFVIEEADGSPAALEPYMGMDGHAVVVREDGGVFIHLHPMGTVSSAARLAFELRGAADTLPGMLAPRLAAADAERAAGHAAHATAVGALSFPYAFPSAGRYQVWVQVKRAGRVFTAAFPLAVSAATP